MKLGAHQSIAGGFSNSLVNIKKIGGNCLQIFSSSPRFWASANIPQDKIDEFLKIKEQLNIDPIFFHACYLINLADKGYIGQKSVQSLREELFLAEKMGVVGTIVHPGSFKIKDKNGYDFQKVDSESYKIFLQNIDKILDNAPKSTYLILENSGTRKIGSTIDELAKIIKDVSDKRVRICLDTCHLHAAGYDLTTVEKLDTFLTNFDNEIGMEKLVVIHSNDSKDTLGSFRDRHENIGEGQVGLAVFKNLLNHPSLNEKSFIIETPGFDNRGPDKQNLDILKGLIKR